MSKTEGKRQNWLTKRNISMFAVIVVLLAAITITTTTLLVPARSHESFCKLFSENKTELTTRNISLQKRLDIYKKLERVAPSEIAEDMRRVVNAYQSAVDKPEGGLAAELGIFGELNRINEYKDAKCSIN